ncbi:type IV secretion system protein [Sphingomonas daechungensis]|uniref:type IV secretion system protein n=1 Tax=Sphingomonas daechungensis TaxID=1176646 RepID=UPI0037841DFD
MSSCPTFSDGGPSGIAEALRVVDCMSGEAASFAFSRLFGSSALLGQALTAALTLYIAWYAIGLLTGRTSLTVSSLTPRMMTMGVALTFATSWVAYQSVIWNLLVGAPDQIASLLIGTQGSATSLFADRLDTIFAVVAQAAAATEAATGQLPQHATSLASGPDLLWLSALLLLLGTVGVLLVARIALAAMLALGPIFIICGLFEGSRGLFEGWLKAAVLFALTPLLAVLIGGGTIALLSPMLDSLAAAGGQVPLRLTTTLFLAAAVYCALMIVCLKIAGTMVAGWRLPFSASRDRKALDAASAQAQQTQVTATGLELAPAAAGSSDPRMRAIISAASGGTPASYDRPAPSYPLHSASGSSVESAQPTVSSRSDPRLGSLSRLYRPRTVQLQRTSS